MGPNAATRLATAAAVLTGAVLVAAGAQPDSVARAEAEYARAVASIGDSAIRQLDFFPERSQLRVQMAFLDPRSAVRVPFDELAARSGVAVDVVGTLNDRLGGLRPPSDLTGLHSALSTSLRDARDALARLASAAETCRAESASVARCQAPFTSASSDLARAYKRYLAARARIGDQIVDTGTILPRFASTTPQ